MSKVLLQLMGDALGGRMPPVPTYVKDCDFNGDDGRGIIIMTQKRSEARMFESMASALQFYRTRSSVVPTRPDGLPNRPLTAYSIAIISEDQPPM